MGEEEGGWLDMSAVLWVVFVMLLLFWLAGLLLNLTGAFIHLLLIVAFIVLLINLIISQRIT